MIDVQRAFLSRVLPWAKDDHDKLVVQDGAWG
jgi:hypothetical protein